MVYSYTQISQYLRCPRSYRYRYLDGWQEKETRANMAFGRCFEKALGAYFREEDCGAALFKEWEEFRDFPFEYKKGDSWDRLIHQGVHLLGRFAQDNRIRIRNPKKDLQIVADAPRRELRRLHRCPRRTGWQTLPDGLEDNNQPLPGRTPRLALARPAADLLFVADRDFGRGLGRVRAQAHARDLVSKGFHLRRATVGV